MESRESEPLLGGGRPLSDAQQCHARSKRSHERCRQPVVPGKRVCFYHGGAPGTGAPKGNQNRLKFGFYARQLHLSNEELLDLEHLADRDMAAGLVAEMLVLQVLIGRILSGKEQGKQYSPLTQLEAVGRGLEHLLAVLRMHRSITGEGGDLMSEHFLAAVREARERLGLASGGGETVRMAGAEEGTEPA